MSEHKHDKLSDDEFDAVLEKDNRFLKRIARARKSLAEGKGIRLENVVDQPEDSDIQRK